LESALNSQVKLFNHRLPFERKIIATLPEDELISALLLEADKFDVSDLPAGAAFLSVG
jgi:hypothetical protein